MIRSVWKLWCWLPIALLCSSTAFAQDSIPSSQESILKIEVDVNTLRGLLLLEQLYLDRGMELDSLYRIVGNCAEVGELTTRSYERELAARRACEALTASLMDYNAELRRSNRRYKWMTYSALTGLAAFVTYSAINL
jgi:hypothetical protein